MKAQGGELIRRAEEGEGEYKGTGEEWAGEEEIKVQADNSDSCKPPPHHPDSISPYLHPVPPSVSSLPRNFPTLKSFPLRISGNKNRWIPRKTEREAEQPSLSPWHYKWKCFPAPGFLLGSQCRKSWCNQSLRAGGCARDVRTRRRQHTSCVWGDDCVTGSRWRRWQVRWSCNRMKVALLPSSSHPRSVPLSDDWLQPFLWDFSYFF